MLISRAGIMSSDCLKERKLYAKIFQNFEVIFYRNFTNKYEILINGDSFCPWFLSRPVDSVVRCNDANDTKGKFREICQIPR